ncbi:hypothetical protein IT881_09525 [Erythrobacter sp. A30-3]|nr:hypothetical protein IT881_09525 [Erythrobacter sp. A30-3]
MSLSNVLSAITLPSVSSPGISTISTADPIYTLIVDGITTLYNNSPNHARNILEQAAANGHLNFYESTVGNQQAIIPATGQKAIGIDVGQISNLYYFNSQGKIVSEVFELTLIHEITHTLNYNDPLPPTQRPTNAQMSSSFDFDGDVIRLQNQVAIELGLSDNVQRSYYAAMDARWAFFSQFNISNGYSYSGGSTIDNVVVPENQGIGNDVIDLSSSFIPNSSDIIFGFSGDDELAGGNGNDHIYGGTGNDLISGGAGDDVLIGEAGNDIFFAGGGADIFWGGEREAAPLPADGTDTVDYSNAGYSSIDVILDGSSLKVTGDNVETDTLHSLERIVVGATSANLSIVGSIPTDIDLSVDFAGNSGNWATIDATQSTSGLAIAVNSVGVGYIRSNSTMGEVQFSGSRFVILGSALDDEVDATDMTAEVHIYGSRGSDVLHGGNANDVIYGGLPTLGSIDPTSVEIVGGEGHDYLVSQSNDDLVDGGSGNDFIEVFGKANLAGGEGDDIIRVAAEAHSANIYFSAGDGHDGLVDVPSPDFGPTITLWLEPGQQYRVVVDAVPDANGDFQGMAAAAIINVATGDSFFISESDLTSSTQSYTYCRGGNCGWNDDPSIFFESLYVEGISEAFELSYGSVAQYAVDVADFEGTITQDLANPDGGGGSSPPAPGTPFPSVISSSNVDDGLSKVGEIGPLFGDENFIELDASQLFVPRVFTNKGAFENSPAQISSDDLSIEAWSNLDDLFSDKTLLKTFGSDFQVDGFEAVARIAFDQTRADSATLIDEVPFVDLQMQGSLVRLPAFLADFDTPTNLEVSSFVF